MKDNGDLKTNAGLKARTDNGNSKNKSKILMFLYCAASLLRCR